VMVLPLPSVLAATDPDDELPELLQPARTRADASATAVTLAIFLFIV
jgi:hypothetical protein